MRIVLRLLLAAIIACLADAAFAKGKLLLKVVDEKTQEPIPFRIHLLNEKKVAVKLPPLPFWVDHLSSTPSLELDLTKGNYFFEIEHGPEYVDVKGFFTINDG